MKRKKRKNRNREPLYCEGGSDASKSASSMILWAKYL